jgi:hypothetical protein
MGFPVYLYCVLLLVSLWHRILLFLLFLFSNGCRTRLLERREELGLWSVSSRLREIRFFEKSLRGLGLS